MNETTRNTQNFVGYEYMDVTVNNDMETIYADSYPNFGWILNGRKSTVSGILSTGLKFKRNRKICNKAEITRLQRQFECAAKEIERLENSKTAAASAAAYTIGVVGTAFMAGSVFSYIGGLLPLCIILAVPAFIGWIIPYFCYVRIRAKKTTQVSTLIDQQYDVIYEVCEKANALLAA